MQSLAQRVTGDAEADNVVHVRVGWVARGKRAQWPPWLLWTVRRIFIRWNYVIYDITVRFLFIRFGSSGGDVAVNPLCN